MLSLSYSAAQKYLLSPFAWYAHYMLRLRPVQQGSALVFGSALDAGLNSLLIDKMNGEAPDIAKARAQFDAVFKAVDPRNIKYSKADGDTDVLSQKELTKFLRLSLPIEYFCLSKKGHILLQEYVEQVIPKLDKVLAVQKSIELTNELGDKFTGVIDFIAVIDGKTYVCDNKSASRAYDEGAVGESGQLATYFEAVKHEYALDGAMYVVIPKNLRKKKKPVVDIQFVSGQIPESLLDKTFSDYDTVLHGIKTAQFRCTRNEKGGCCSTPWGCELKRLCESNGTDTTGLKVEPRK